jgi:glutathione S-transferase
MPQTINPRAHLLLSIAFSHYNEKARWAFAYYGIPYTHHLLLPGFHVFSVKPAVERPTTSASIKRSNARTSPHSTPCLVVYGDDLKDVQESLHESHDILRYLSDHFSAPERVNLYESCGAAQEDKVNALEKHYDEVLGRAARMYGYGDILVLNKWRALIPFALLGLREPRGHTPIGPVVYSFTAARATLDLGDEIDG